MGSIPLHLTTYTQYSHSSAAFARDDCLIYIANSSYLSYSSLSTLSGVHLYILES